MHRFKRIIFSLFVFAAVDFFGAVQYPVNSSGLYVGGRVSRLAWKTPDPHFFGYLFGPFVGLDYRRPSHVYGGYRFFVDYGNISAGGCGRSFENIFMQGRLGYTFGKTMLLTPYTGFGVNIATHRRKHAANTCKKFAFVDLAVPVGAILTYHPSPVFSIGFDYQYLPQVDSWERIGGFLGIRFQRKVRTQHCVELPIQFAFPNPRWEHVQYRIVPFYRSYHYGSVNVSFGGTSVICQTGATIQLEPQRAYEFGIRYEIAIW
ncbi:hypothetical protein COB11_04820 [Candidatus Aerophobetes bacterium]|uniref:Outer membrane protein beta-barrel domain-containing protein n=1 Tax=Aerophobetes bacterium TaxID=2030807 RepID=A0A2A4YFY9_UNCAE|nr:MAG: hypothetical protein COB11_04820 [Candidatus Aerophobetes bacterium]